MIKKITTNHWLIIGFILFLLATISRFAFINQIPTGLSHDELNYVINSISLNVNGSGITGEWKPWSLTPVESMLAELPAVYTALFMHLPFPPIVNARLPFILMSLTLPFILGLIALEITKSKQVAYFTWALALFNPWLWQNGRMTFDVFYSMWFYILGIAIFLRGKTYWKLASILPFFFGFYGYQGYKLLLPFIALILSIYLVSDVKNTWKTKKAKSHIMIASIFFLAFLAYLVFT